MSADFRHKKAARLSLLKAQLQIYLYGNPLANSDQVMEVIENTETSGEIQLVLDYIVGELARAPAVAVTS